MPRSLPRPAALLAAFALTPAFAVAEPPSPFDLARGLRENGMADLAVEYLDDQAATNKAPDFQAVLPLERAMVLLASADEEADDAIRDGLTAKARAELERFLKANPRHPRSPEAAVALARVTALGAKGMLARAARIKDDAGYKAAAAAARKPFGDAAKAFAQAATQLEAQLNDASLPPERKQQVTRELVQAELDAAATQYQISRTYIAPTAKEITERAAAIDKAKKAFEAVAEKHPGTSARFVALAWAGQCELAIDAPIPAEKRFAEVRRDPSAQAFAGKRLVRYFEARTKFEKALTEGTPAALQASRTAAAEWLRAYGTGRPTPEAHAVRYQLALVKQREALAQVKEDPKTKKLVIPGSAVALFRDAERDYRRLTESENEYTDRAAEKRNEVIRMIVGDAEKDPAKVTSFDEAVMAGMVQLDKALKDPGEGKDGRMAKVVALLERAVALPTTREAARDRIDAQLRLAFAYLLADKPYQAAVLGEHLARSVRTSGQAARGGSYAVRAYLIAAGKNPPDDAAARKADQDRAVGIAKFLDKAFPADPSTDDTRILLGQVLAKDGRVRDAFDLLSRVSPTHPRAAVARLMEGSAGFELLRPAAGLSPAEKAEVSRRLVADIQAVPKPNAETPPADAESYARMSLLLAQSYLFDVATFPKAEQAAAAAAAVLKDLPQIPDAEKQAIGFQTEETRLRAVYGQTVPLFRDGKSAEVMARLDPVVADIVKAGPAVKAGQDPVVGAAAKRLDDFRRNEVIVLALKTRIREKAVDKAGALFDLLKQLGGSVDASVQALAQLVAGVRPEIDSLRKDGKTDEANALVDGVGKLLDKVIGEPALTPGQKVYLGRALKEMGSFEKAAEVLKAVPAPPADQLAKSPSELQGDARTAVLLYRGAQLELAESYRLGKKFADADAVLKPAMDEKTGWAKTAPNFRKEALYLVEAKADDAAKPADAQKLWGEALAGWNKIAGEYSGMVRRPLPTVPPEPKAPPADASEQVKAKYEAEVKARADAEQKQAEQKRQKETIVKPLYFDAYYEVQRCLTRGNMKLLKGNPEKLAASLDKIAETIKRVDEQNPDLKDEVKAKFADLLDEYPELKKRYDAKGGKNLKPPAGEPSAAAPPK